ncbi:YihY/virulence factor BrkB family protein [Leucobacter luti]|uniref:YihY/virulence factor BrkB family protein n=1 Tax=Leucobacter luti TaxID=340320 RepID=UPI003D058F48
MSPQNSHAQTGPDAGASSVKRVVNRGASLWQRLQRTRPMRTLSHFTDVGGSVLSGGMSYQALFAVFAALYVGFAVFGIVLRDRPELLDTLIEQLNTFVPGLVGSGDDAAVDVKMLLGANLLNWTGVAAGVSLLWVAMAWFTGTRRSIRIIFGLDVKEYKNAVLLKLRDLVLAVTFGLAILISAALTVMSSNVLEWIAEVFNASPDSWYLGTLGTVVRYAAMYVFDVAVLYAMHRYLAEIRIPRMRLLAGCALGGIALVVLKILGGLLLNGASSNPLLATFAVLIGLLLWFNFICRALLLTAAWIATGIDQTIGLPLQDTEAE